MACASASPPLIMLLPPETWSDHNTLAGRKFL
jgi:hypothetical protein